MPQVEQIKNELIVVIAKGKANLKKNEDNILSLLANSKGMILDDVELIRNLKESKITATAVKQSLEESEIKQVEIDAARQQYKPVATRGSILYFVIADLSLIDPMYQFSLNYFSRLFNIVIENSPKSSVIESRIMILIN
jgi:dynein heavy chain